MMNEALVLLLHHLTLETDMDEDCREDWQMLIDDQGQPFLCVRTITEHPSETPLKHIIIDAIAILHLISDSEEAFQSIIEQKNWDV